MNVKPPPRLTALILAVILAGGGLARVAYLRERSREPDFDRPAVDAAYNDYLARRQPTPPWTQPGPRPDPWLLQRPHFRPPGYPWFLRAAYFLFGPGYLAPRFIQALLGLINCWLVFLLARDWFDTPSALLAAAGMSFYWVLIYFEGELLEVTLSISCALAALLALSRAGPRTPLKKGLAAGAALGALCLFRPNALIFLPAAGWWLWREYSPAPARIRAGAVAALIAAAAAAIAPATVRNRLVAGDNVLISANLGMSLLIGNNEQADGSNHYLPGWGRFASPFDYPAAVRRLERDRGESFSYSRASRYYSARAVRFMLSRPAAFARLTLRKAALFWGPVEVSNNREIMAARGHSPVLSLLPGDFSFVLAAAAVGIVFLVAGRRGGGAGAGLLFTGLYFISILPFTQAARYRVVVLPVLLALGGWGLRRCFDLFRRRRWAAPAAAAAVGAGTWFLLSLNPAGYRPSEVKWFFDRGGAYAGHGRWDEAAGQFTRALERRPGHLESLVNLGNVHIQRRDFPAARETFEKALRVDPVSAPAHHSLAGLYMRKEEPDAAWTHFHRAIETDPGHSEAWFGLGEILRWRGATEEAADYYRRAAALDPFEPEFRLRLGEVLAATGKEEEAAGHFEFLREHRPDWKPGRRAAEKFFGKGE